MSGKNLVKFTGVLLLALWFSCSGINAQPMPPLPNPWNNQIGNWSFEDTNWYSDFGYAPVSFTNLDNPAGFDGNALQVDSTNAAWLQYNIIEDDGFENLTFDQGTIELWVLPDWNSTTNGGTGPGDWGRLIDVGAYSTNAPSSWWSLYFTPDGNNLCFSSETNGVFTNYLNVPISWDSSTWHLISLTYDQTQSQLYIDGQLVTNGAGVQYLPSASVVSNGFFVGSDHTGMQQAHAQIDDLSTYNYVIWTTAITNDYAAGMNLISPPDSGGLMSGGFGGGFGMDDSSDSFGSLYGASLWLQITNVSGGLVFANLMNATDYVYAILSTTNLAIPSTNWSVATELFPTGDQTNVMPFTVPTLSQPILFLKAEDWTGVTENGNTTPDWWFWEYYGTTALSDTNLDSQGYPLVYDYTNSYDPNIISFSISLSYKYVNTNHPTLPLDIFAGVPSSVAVLVNDTNLADAVWQPYTSSNVVATLGADGNYNVTVGLRGLPTNATASWQSVALIKDTVAPTLAITNPTTGSVSQSTVQFQGYASKPLSNLTFDVSNAIGDLTNQQGFLTGQFFDTNLLAYTTNYFQCPDVGLGDGTNTITLHAVDWAGNRTDASYTLNYTASTNPPALTIIWPPAGTAISGSSFTVQAQVDNPAATITASIADSSGDTNTVQGLVEKSGLAWVQNLPLNAGTNSVTVTATGLNGSTSVTSFNVIKNDVGLIINPLESDQLNQSSVSVFGEVGDPSLCVWVNGIQASVDDYGNWEADNVPVSPVGTASLSVQVYVGDPVLVASQNQYQPQPVTVGMMSYSGHHDLSFYGSGTETINWFYQSGGNYVTADEGGGNFEISSNENGVANIDLDGFVTPFDMPWEYASLTIPQFYGSDTYPYGNYTQTRVMVEPGGQTVAGTTNLYLVRAYAIEFSTDEMELGAYIGTYGWDYEHLLAGVGSTPDYNGYFGDTPLPPEWLKIQDHALINSGITNTYSFYDAGGYKTFNAAWGETVVAAPAGVNWDVTPVASQVYQNQAYTFNVQAFDATPQMLVDSSRQGSLDSLTTPGSPCRFWVNDSQEHGDDESSEGAANDQIPGSSSPNYSWNHPQGRSDYINFFPVALCLSNTLQMLPLTNGYIYHLSQADGAVKFLYTDLTPSNAFDYLTNSVGSTDYGTIAGYDPSFSPDSSGVISYTNLDAADLVHVVSSSASGMALNTNWLNQIQANGGTGVILMEGCATSTAPVVLEIWHKDQFGNTNLLGGVPLYLNINGVEQMFRHANFSYVTGANTVDPRADAPNEPLTNGKNLVFLHGYNVNQQQARGVESEMFKRFYWSGSKAKFYGVTWNGAVSQSTTFGFTPDFHTNVVNALLTASPLASFLGSLSGETTVAAHSLGNMVLLSAISDYGATPNHYFMIDAAVPVESVQGNAATEPAMTYSTWQNYSNRLYASDWWQLFTNGDARSTLTWSNRLGNLGSVDIYNFYSSGEEVLREDIDDPPSTIIGSGAQEVVNAISFWGAGAGLPFGTYAWVWQEKGKGTDTSDTFIGSTHGGWGLNINYETVSFGGVLIPMAADQAALLTNDQLQTNALFNMSVDTALFTTDTSGSTYAAAHHDRILSDAIPALTLPVGANYVTRFGLDRSFNMSDEFENGWPSTRSTGFEAYKWHHSDFDYVAYPFTYKLFSLIVTSGNLK